MQKLFKVNVSVVIFKNDKILIVKRSMDEDIFPGFWGIPGGTVDANDTTLETALERELMEEVGIKIKNLHQIQNNIVEKEMHAVVYIVYTADYDSGEPIAMDGTEVVDWMTLAEIYKLDFTPKTVDIIKTAHKIKSFKDNKVIN
jgi:8-oxo-dGTP diphosphatase